MVYRPWLYSNSYNRFSFQRFVCFIFLLVFSGGSGSSYYWNLAFYFRTPTWFLDFKRKGIKLLVDEKRGLVPLMVSNPGIVDVGTSLNEVVGSISDGLHEREMLYDQDFWAKYGNVVAIGMLIGFFVIGMIFIIKYQETFWENSMNGLQAVLKTIQDTASPTLK